VCAINGKRYGTVGAWPAPLLIFCLKEMEESKYVPIGINKAPISILVPTAVSDSCERKSQR
jgi:hypothetical protein